MTAGQFPDAEQLTVAYLLRAGGAVTTAVSGRVYTQIPETALLPLIRVTRVGGPPTNDVEDAPRIQVEAWADAGAQSTAMDVIRTVVAAVPGFAGQQPTTNSWVVGPYVTNGPVASEDAPTGQERYWIEVGFNTYVEGT